MGTEELLSVKHGEYVKGGRQRALEEQQMEVYLPPTPNECLFQLLGKLKSFWLFTSSDIVK